MKLYIHDFEIHQEPKIASKIRIELSEITFNVSAKFFIYFLMSNEDIIKVETIIVEGDDYMKWNNNDDYIIDLILSRLGLEQKPAPIELPKPEIVYEIIEA